MGNPIAHFEILGKDPATLRRFYGEVFGWQIETPEADDPMQYAMAETQAGPGAVDGGIGKAQHGDGGTTVYVRVDDLDAALAEIEAKGGRKLMPPRQIGPSTSIALFADPEGHTVGLIKE